MNLKENQNSILHGMVMVAREPDLVLRCLMSLSSKIKESINFDNDFFLTLQLVTSATY